MGSLQNAVVASMKAFRSFDDGAPRQLFVRRSLRHCILSGRRPHHPFESDAERGVGFVAQGYRDRCDGLVACRQAITSEQHSPSQEVVDGRRARDGLEAEGELGSRHARLRRKGWQCPAFARRLVHRRDRRRKPGVAEGEQPAGYLAASLSEIEPEGFHQKKLCQIASDQNPAGRSGGQFAAHASETPSQSLLVRVVRQSEDRRHGSKQHLGTPTYEGEMATEYQRLAATIDARDAVSPVGLGKLADVDRRERQIFCKPEPPPVRKKDAVVRFQQDRLGVTFNLKPALSGDDGETLDAVMLFELKRPVPSEVAPTGDVSVWLQVGKNVRERICSHLGRSQQNYEFSLIDHPR